ncbi:phage tail protein [Pantoea sp. CCBC3-3-1]|uniref:phage tail protein n=1 Tax=Pantoea sp. CCBC3-3-1 TaxID=2490851 RepID=UPI0020C24C11|nr:phage tail protein [Pantoea sp. CCBC3-3-1]
MTEAVVVTAKSFPAPETLALITDVQYREPYSSAAINRKLRGILTAGIYQGFIPEVGEGLNLVIASGTEGGTVSFDIDAYYQLTARQQADVTIAMTAGTTTVVVLEASYSIGQETYQVNSSSSVSAAQIKLLVSGTALSQNQVELCTVTVPAGTTQLTADMINTSNRVAVALGVSLGSDTDSDSEQVAANLLGLKKTLNAAKEETETQLAEHIGAENPHSQYLQIANALSEIKDAGLVAKALTALGLGDGSAVPVGVPMPYPAATAPDGWLKCNGASFSATTYPLLAKVYPSLKLPDLRGEFIRGWDDGRGADSARVILSSQYATAVRTGAIDYFGVDSTTTNATVGTSFSDADSTTTSYPTNAKAPNGGTFSSVLTDNSMSGTQLPTGFTNPYGLWITMRPRNIAFNYIIRAA